MSSNKCILLTGASGFLGNEIFQNFSTKYKVLVLGRRKLSTISLSNQHIVDFDLYDDEAGEFPEGVDVVIHSAARVHVSDDGTDNSLDLYRKTNVDFSLALARRAYASGVKRFIYVSSVKVNGESTGGRDAFVEDEDCYPEDFYAISKLEAENALKEYSEASGLDLVIIRPPMIYGPGVKANFNSLIKLSRMPVPLPFGSVQNRRSMVYVENVVDLIEVCIFHPKAIGQVFFVSDDCDVSLPDLISEIRVNILGSSLLFPFPVFLLRNALSLIGKSRFSDRLLGDLAIDISKAKNLLSWQPPHSFKEGVRKTVKG